MSHGNPTCDVCGKPIPHGTTHLTVSVQREKFVLDDERLEVDGEAEFVFLCHEECVPPTIQISLERFRKLAP